MAGVDSAGLGEVMQMVLARFSDQDKARLVKVRYYDFCDDAVYSHSERVTECLRHRWTIISSRPTSTIAGNSTPGSTARDAIRDRTRCRSVA